MAMRKPSWSNSVTLRCWNGPKPAWRGVLYFYHTGAGSDEAEEPSDVSVEGYLLTRSYYVADDEGEALTWVTDTLVHGADRLGVEMRNPVLLAEYDDGDVRPVPEDWPGLLEEQTKRLGWRVPDQSRSGR